MYKGLRDQINVSSELTEKNERNKWKRSTLSSNTGEHSCHFSFSLLAVNPSFYNSFTKLYRHPKITGPLVTYDHDFHKCHRSLKFISWHTYVFYFFFFAVKQYQERENDTWGFFFIYTIGQMYMNCLRRLTV